MTFQWWLPVGAWALMGLDGPQGSPVGEIFQLRAVTSCEVLGKKCHPTQLAEATWRLGDLAT